MKSNLKIIQSDIANAIDETFLSPAEGDFRFLVESMLQSKVVDSHVFHNASGSDSVIITLGNGKRLTITVALENKK